MEVTLNVSELNAAIYDYLLRTGMQHTAFAFRAECADNFILKPTTVSCLESVYMQGLLFQKLKDEEDLNFDLPNASSEASLKNYIDDMIKKTLGVDLSAISYKEKLDVEKDESTLIQVNGNRPSNLPNINTYRFKTADRFIYGIEKNFKEIFVIDMRHSENNKIYNVIQNIQEKKPNIIFEKNIYIYSSDFFMILEPGTLQLKAAFDIPADLNLTNIYEVDNNLLIIECDTKILVFNDFKLEANFSYLTPLGHSKHKIYLNNKVDKQLFRYDINSRGIEELVVMGSKNIIDFKIIPEHGLSILIIRDKLNDKKNILGLIRDDDYDFLLTTEINSKFDQISIYEDSHIMLIAENSIKCFNLESFDVYLAFKTLESIKKAFFISENRILIEIIGNRFKLFDNKSKLLTDLEKTDSASFMLYNPEMKTLIEIKNFETVNLISL